MLTVVVAFGLVAGIVAGGCSSSDEEGERDVAASPVDVVFATDDLGSCLRQASDDAGVSFRVTTEDEAGNDANTVAGFASFDLYGGSAMLGATVTALPSAASAELYGQAIDFDTAREENVLLGFSEFADRETTDMLEATIRSCLTDSAAVSAPEVAVGADEILTCKNRIDDIDGPIVTRGLSCNEAIELVLSTESSEGWLVPCDEQSLEGSGFACVSQHLCCALYAAFLRDDAGNEIAFRYG